MNRRAFLSGLGALLAAPAIVRASSLMVVKPLDLGWPTLYDASLPNLLFTETDARWFRYLDYFDRTRGELVYATADMPATL